MERGRARDLGVVIGTYPPGPRNAVTDVEGVRVGHRTIVRDPAPDGAGAVRTGVTAVFPHEGLPWIERVYAGTDILNGFGELIGINQIAEWGLLHSPVVMTSSLAIGRAYDATVRWRTARHATTTHEGGDMPVVCECDDSYLSDVTTFPLTDEDVSAALDAAEGGDVAEGCVGAGTGTQCMDFKGGIGTASQEGPGWVDRGRARPDELRRARTAADRRRAGRSRDHRPDAGGTHRGFGDRGRRDRRADGAAPAPSSRGSRRARARAVRLDRPQRVGRADARVLDGQPDPAGVTRRDGRRARGARRPRRTLPRRVQRALRGNDRGGRGGGRERAVHRRDDRGSRRQRAVRTAARADPGDPRPPRARARARPNRSREAARPDERVPRQRRLGSGTRATARSRRRGAAR